MGRCIRNQRKRICELLWGPWKPCSSWAPMLYLAMRMQSLANAPPCDGVALRLRQGGPAPCKHDLVGRDVGGAAAAANQRAQDHACKRCGCELGIPSHQSLAVLIAASSCGLPRNSKADGSGKFGEARKPVNVHPVGEKCRQVVGRTVSRSPGSPSGSTCLSAPLRLRGARRPSRTACGRTGTCAPTARRRLS